MTMLIPVLGDQLSPSLASLQHVDRSKAVILLMEVWDEATYVRHHKKKIAFIFSAMRHFAEELRSDGWSVDYVALEDPKNTQSFTGEVARAARKYGATTIRTVAGAEYRVSQAQKTWSDKIGIP